jgi:signal peptidase I
MTPLLFSALRRGILLAFLVLIGRTFLVEGFLTPVIIGGASMMPTFRGPHRVISCAQCAHRFHCAVTGPRRIAHATCPECDFAGNEWRASPPARGERILIDRTAFLFRPPRRWETVAYIPQKEGRKQVIKRILGLPGETVRFHHGDLLIDGQIARKPLEIQREIIFPVEGGGWDALENGLSAKSALVFPPPGVENLHWWGFRCRRTIPTSPPFWETSPAAYAGGKPSGRDASAKETNSDESPPVILESGVTNRRSSNQMWPSRPRQIHPVRDLMLRFDLPHQREAPVWVLATDGEDVFALHFGEHGNTVKLATKDFSEVKKLPEASSGVFKVEMSLVDRRFLVAIDGRAVWKRDLPLLKEEAVVPMPLAVATTKKDFPVEQMEVFRDCYYGPGVESEGPQPEKKCWKLGKNRYFLVGDNPSISRDSRHEIPTPGERASRLVGKPVPFSRFISSGRPSRLPKNGKKSKTKKDCTVR